MWSNENYELLGILTFLSPLSIHSTHLSFALMITILNKFH